MFEEYTKEQLRKLFYDTPEELQEASTSIENTDLITIACKHIGLEPENTKKVIELIGFVFLGLLPLEEFKKSLAGELKIKKPDADKLYQEIYRTVFFSVKYQLYQLYEQGDIAGEISSEKPLQDFKKEKQYDKISTEKEIEVKEETDIENIKKENNEIKEKSAQKSQKEQLPEQKEQKGKETPQSFDSYRESIE